MPTYVLDAIRTKKFILIILACLVISITMYIFLGYFYGNRAVLSEERESITAIGTIEAKTVQLAFKIPGKIEELLIDEGSKVEVGQEVAVLETTELEAKLIQAEGLYEITLKQAEQANQGISLTDQTVAATISQAQAVVEKARVGLEDARQEYERAVKLNEAGALSDSQLDKATNNFNARQNDLSLAEGKLNEAIAARTQVSISKAQAEAASAQIKQAEGALMEAETYYNNARLKSSLNGYVTQKFIEAGEMVNAGTPVFEITDLDNTYVKIYIDESKIGRVKLDQEAQVEVEAMPGKVFKGKVVWINDAGEFAVRKAINELHSHDIRSFEVKIAVPNLDRNLKTGMTAKVKIIEENK